MTDKHLKYLITWANNEIKEWTKFLEIVKKMQFEKELEKKSRFKKGKK